MSLGGGRDEIPKGGRAGRARSLGIWPRGAEITEGGGAAKSLGHLDRWGHDMLIVCPRIQCPQDILQVLAGLF